MTPQFTTVIGTVAGDLHDVGKSLVAMMWRAARFDVIDLGTDVAAEAFVAAVTEHDADLVGLSALLTTLLTTSMGEMGRVVEAVRASGHRAGVVVGGAPITSKFAGEIGAHGFAADAGAAVVLARQLVDSAARPR